MPDEPRGVIYPRYCFHLAPTFDTWCFLKVSAIHALDQHSGFEGEKFFFYKNLPMTWARIVGVVVAIDEISGRRIYTIDDSSGACIEAVVSRPAAKPATASAAATTKDSTTAADVSNDATPAASGFGEIAVGAVVDVKGRIDIFWSEKQLKIVRMSNVLTTEREMVLWEKRATFQRDVLAEPWILRDKDIRRCRKEAERTEVDVQKRRERLKAAAELAKGRRPGTVLEPSSASRQSASTKQNKELDKKGHRGHKTSDRDLRATSLRRAAQQGAASGKYSALGL